LMQRISVLLPLPLGPQTTTTCPAAMLKSMSLSTCSAPNHLLTLRNSITVVADLQKDTIAKRWSAYYINNGVLQELLALLPVSSIRLLAVNPENIDSVVVIP
jgi:hypothetical protein